MSETVGFIGLGVLGSAIAGNLLESGYQVVGCDTDDAHIAALREAGGDSAATPSEIADRTDVVFLFLPTAESWRQVVGGAGGLIRGGAEGQIVVELSTFAIAEKEAARDVLAEVGKILLDCPVSGNRIMALQRKLTAFGSGDRAAWDRVEPVVRGFANRALHVGDFGCGMKMKFCGNIPGMRDSANTSANTPIITAAGTRVFRFTGRENSVPARNHKPQLRGSPERVRAVSP